MKRLYIIPFLVFLLLLSQQLAYGSVDVLQNRSVVEKSLWSGWKTRFANTLEGVTIIIDPFTGKAFSEAMGHALILSVQFNDQAFFDQIVRGLQAYFLNKNGLYAWEISTDGKKIVGSGNKSASASETEINVLTGLLQASRLVERGIWQKSLDYRSLAGILESNIWDHEILDCCGLLVLLPSDDKANPYWPIIRDGKDKIEKVAWAPTYFNPAYLKIIASSFPKRNWNKVIADGYYLSSTVLENSPRLLTNDQNVHGLNPVPAWVWLKAVNGPKTDLVVENYFLGSTHPGTTYSNEYDSIRIPIYLGLDYLWNLDKRSLDYMKSFVELAGVDEPGKAFVGAAPGIPKGWNSALAVGQYGIANKVIDKADAFRDCLNEQTHEKEGYIGDPPKYYYNQTFDIYAFLILNDRLAKL